ncbi:hypothetical protein MDMS009_1345 [Methylophaga thiooxydans DMS010]|uniref:Uncharacterized protein n=1 Tax=Methylophaga thiooxydans DMS010 TaxID=637616 RepID=C0N5W2_9GAMM|nr:hypothetical protein MDMS009_1345 [Methylophaga thiooxydans DMS010]
MRLLIHKTVTLNAIKPAQTQASLFISVEGDEIYLQGSR